MLRTRQRRETLGTERKSIKSLARIIHGAIAASLGLPEWVEGLFPPLRPGVPGPHVTEGRSKG